MIRTVESLVAVHTRLLNEKIKNEEKLEKNDTKKDKK